MSGLFFFNCQISLASGFIVEFCLMRNHGEHKPHGKEKEVRKIKRDKLELRLIPYGWAVRTCLTFHRRSARIQVYGTPATIWCNWLEMPSLEYGKVSVLVLVRGLNHCCGENVDQNKTEASLIFYGAHRTYFKPVLSSTGLLFYCFTLFAILIFQEKPGDKVITHCTLFAYHWGLVDCCLYLSQLISHLSS